jgi:hypothetical protein
MLCRWGQRVHRNDVSLIYIVLHDVNSEENVSFYSKCLRIVTAYFKRKASHLCVVKRIVRMLMLQILFMLTNV